MQSLPVDEIKQIAANSALARLRIAPVGYVKGMAVMFGVVQRKVAQGDPAALEMSKAASSDSRRDALAHYASSFAALGMRNDVSGVDTLRHLFVLMFGLGLRESSGRYCEGWDRQTHRDRPTAELAEAGLFQMSWSARGISRFINPLCDEYMRTGDGYKSIFAEGVTLTGGDLEIVGPSGDAAIFQGIMKEMPGLAVETAAVGLRNDGGAMGYWRPIRRREVQLLPEADEMLRQVQRLVAGLFPVVIPDAQPMRDTIQKAPWMLVANALQGEAEIAGKAANPRIVEMFKVAGVPDDPAFRSDETAWSAAFVNACLRCAGYQGTKSALAVSFAGFGFDLGRTPQPGCVVLFKPLSAGASGHVAFYVGEDGDRIKVLGGNQSDQVKVASFPKSKWRAYRWPSQPAPLPETTLPTILTLAPNQVPDHLHAAGVPRAAPPPLIRPVVADNFDQVQPIIEHWEGGYSDHPADPGGATNMGITQEMLREWRHTDVTTDDVNALQREEARQIFRARYWQPLRCDEMPIALALMTYNAGVNSGIGRGARWLQQALNKQGQGLDVDGKVGPLTLSACARADVARAVDDFAETQDAFYRSLSTFPTFGKEWLNRLTDVKSKALAMGPKLADGMPTEDVVDFSVFGPPAAPPGESILIQVFLHLIEQAERVSFLASAMDSSTTLKGTQSLQIAIKRGAKVDISFAVNTLMVDEPVQSVVWQGQPVFCQFVVTIPRETSGQVYVPAVRVSVDGRLVGCIKFRISSNPLASNPQARSLGDHARRYEHVFVSYATKDRKEVLKRVQMLQIMKTGFFQDLLSLEPGDRWEKKLYQNIARCDLFLLFWSEAAKSSKWVIQEVEYALKQQRQNPKSEPDIVPVILQEDVLPPPSLAELNFNDRIQYLISLMP